MKASALLHYFCDIRQTADHLPTGDAQKPDHPVASYVDMDKILQILKDGADINCTDDYGQTIMHEVAGSWTTELAKLMVEQGADVNKADMYGRTPLHVAAASDNAGLCLYLVSVGADPEARTYIQLHTAVFFAVCYDACEALKVLVYNCKCQFDDLPLSPLRDSRFRTPLFVAAELDRSDAARMLLEFGADAKVRDRDGQPCMVPLITKMAPVFEVIVSRSQYDLLGNPAIAALMDVMWKNFAW
ncbi:hypothetical protein SprV_0502014400 [Sparganum proliferum]